MHFDMSRSLVPDEIAVQMPAHTLPTRFHFITGNETRL